MPSHLTLAQLQALKADIAADPVLSALPPGSDSDATIAAAYNQLASPVWWVWKTAISKSDVVNVVSTDSDGSTQRSFIWAGNGFITRSAGEQAAWRELFTNDIVNPSLANVRAAFTDIFSGSGNAASNRTHLANVGRMQATRLQRLSQFSSGVGSAASPATLAANINQEFVLTLHDVQEARNTPS